MEADSKVSNIKFPTSTLLYLFLATSKHYFGGVVISKLRRFSITYINTLEIDSFSKDDYALVQLKVEKFIIYFQNAITSIHIEIAMLIGGQSDEFKEALFKTQSLSDYILDDIEETSFPPKVASAITQRMGNRSKVAKPPINEPAIVPLINNFIYSKA